MTFFSLLLSLSLSLSSGSLLILPEGVGLLSNKNIWIPIKAEICQTCFQSNVWPAYGSHICICACITAFWILNGFDPQVDQTVCGFVKDIN